MKYNFDEVTSRKNTGSLKWDVAENELPMWVADMDFQTAPEIRQALLQRAEHGIFGYSIVPDEWYDSIISWWERRHSFKMEKDWLIFCTGVIPAISSIVRKLTTPAENVLVMTPVYNTFYNSILNNGRNVLECPLEYDGKSYSINFDTLEEKLANPQTSLMILCNPHNPTGQIWQSETLSKIGSLCVKNNVLVLSDEIHCDLTEIGKEYIPFAAVSHECKMNSITCIAPTKTFNIAGLQTAAVSVPNKNIRHRVWRGLNTDEVAEPNAFAVSAATAAFNFCEEWLDELRVYISENKSYVEKYLEENLPVVKAVKSEATYLMWLDCSAVTDNTKRLTDYIRAKTGLYVSNGGQYGGDGKFFIRLNVACPRSLLCDGMDRFKQGVEAFLKH